MRLTILRLARDGLRAAADRLDRALAPVEPVAIATVDGAIDRGDGAPPARRSRPPEARPRQELPEQQALARELVRRHGSAVAAAAETGLSVASLRRWKRGGTIKPESLEALRVAAAGLAPDLGPVEPEGEDQDAEEGGPVEPQRLASF